LRKREIGILLGVIIVFVTISVNGVQAEVTVTIPASADAWLNQEHPDLALGGANTLYVRSYRGANNMRSLLTFDLTAIPSGASITSAKLYLYAWFITWPNSPSYYRTYCAHRVTSAWEESTVTWNSQPMFSPTSTSETVVTGYGTEGWFSWDVTADVQNGHLNPSAWHGILIKDKVEGSYDSRTCIFYSRENPSYPELKPYLEVTYTLWQPIPEFGVSIALMTSIATAIYLFTTKIRQKRH